MSTKKFIPAPTWSLYLGFLGTKMFLSIAQSAVLIMATLLMFNALKIHSFANIEWIKWLNLTFWLTMVLSFAVYLFFLAFTFRKQSVPFAKIAKYFYSVLGSILITFLLGTFFLVGSFIKPDWDHIFLWIFIFSTGLMLVSLITSYWGSLYLSFFWEKLEKKRFEQRKQQLKAN